MGLKVVKCSDQAHARICTVAGANMTYLADALDILLFGKVDSEGKRIEVRDEARSPKRVRAAKNRAEKGKRGSNRAPKLVEGLEDVYED